MGTDSSGSVTDNAPLRVRDPFCRAGIGIGDPLSLVILVRIARIVVDHCLGHVHLGGLAVAHKTPDDQLTRFLGEDGDAIYDFLGTVAWDAEPKSEDFKASVRIALNMGIDKRVLNGIAKRYLAAVKSRDFATISACAAEVEELRAARTRDGLAEFR